MNEPTQDNRVLIGSGPQHRLGGNDTFDQVISRHKEIYQWALENQYAMERRCLEHVVMRNLRAIEGLEFFEPVNGDSEWAPASERRIRQSVLEALEEGLLLTRRVKTASSMSLDAAGGSTHSSRSI